MKILSFDVGIKNLSYAMGNYKEALVAYERVLEKNPKYAPALVNAGVTCYLLDDLDQAIHYRKLVALNVIKKSNLKKIQLFQKARL